MKILSSDQLLKPSALTPRGTLCNILFCSGQIPLNPQTMEIVGKTVEEQTIQVFKNISFLSSQNLSITNIVKTMVFLKIWMIFLL